MRAVLAKDRDFAERIADTSLSADLSAAEFAAKPVVCRARAEFLLN
jgi:hypothetical protein